MIDFRLAQEKYKNYLFFKLDNNIQEKITRQSAINESEYIYLLYLHLKKDMSIDQISKKEEIRKDKVNRRLLRAEKLLHAVIKNITSNGSNECKIKPTYILFDEVLDIYEMVDYEIENEQDLFELGEHIEYEKIVDEIIRKAEKIVEVP